MNIQESCTQLQTQGQAITSLCSKLSDVAVRWKPDPDNWSVLEVLNHLVDEEILDFRRRLDHILHTPSQPWPQIDPVRWVTEKHYSEQKMDETLKKFITEREKSLAWLTSLKDPDMAASSSLPWGTLTAGDMLASWVAHDLLHLRQLVTLRYQLTSAASQPYKVDYAGKW